LRAWHIELKQLREEDTKLKRLVAELSLDKVAMTLAFTSFPGISGRD
jgi:hypothetical protein